MESAQIAVPFCEAELWDRAARYVDPRRRCLAHGQWSTASEALDTEYENGVADVPGFLAAEAVIVERNVFMVGARSGKRRQIDVRVTGPIFGPGSATMVVDCKRYRKPIDVNTVGAFVGLVEDVGADVGLIVTSTGISDAARAYASNVRGIRVDILSVRDLDVWSPKGTVNFDYAVPGASYPDASGECSKTAGRSGRIRPLRPATRVEPAR